MNVTPLDFIPLSGGRTILSNANTDFTYQAILQHTISLKKSTFSKNLLILQL